MAVTLHIKSGRDFCIKDLEVGLPYSKAVKQIKEMTDIIKFYANPETYFAIGIFPDNPSGDLMQDFSETDDLGMKPGKKARDFLAKLESEEKNGLDSNSPENY